MLTIKSLHDRVAQIYYTYGLFCASHPWTTIISVIISVSITCIPLLSNLPIPGKTSFEHRTSKLGFAVPEGVRSANFQPEGFVDEKKPRWLVGEPVAYVQQVVMKSAVSPWQKSLKPYDAFRAPLASAFKIVEELDNFKYTSGGKDQSLADNCYRVSESLNVGRLQELLPQYTCFIVSPANFWRQDILSFKKNAHIIDKVYENYGQVVGSQTSIKDLLFGIPWSQTGITKYPIRSRQRIITYAVTIIMKKYDSQFVSALTEMLERHHPDTSQNVNNSEVQDIVHVYFKDVNYIVEYTPLLVIYLVMLLYLYFSVRKIELVKSKIGLAISAVVTVLASLLMSVSICTLFGMTPTLNGGEIFPYLAVIVGVENVLVITKSVVSTPVHLDVKIRVAQGLSREGWSITKNLVTELVIVLIGFFTFVPAIQEFCAFALVGLLSDFYLQMAFFATVLSVDIRRMELSDLHKQSVQQAVQDESSNAFSIQPLVLCPFVRGKASSSHRSHSSPPPDPTPPMYSPIVQPNHVSPPPSPNRSVYEGQTFFRASPQSDRPKYEMPRRVKFFYFLARFRIVQKLIMVCTLVWIFLIMYKTGLVDKLTGDNVSDTLSQTATPKLPAEVSSVMESSRDEEFGDRPVEHKNLELWRMLSHKHWPTLFQYYNISLSGRYISILPSIHLSEVIDPLKAIQMRHPKENETTPKPLDWNDSHHLDNFLPKTDKEFIITIFLCCLTVVVITYFMVHLYRCMCSRNYSRWRHSWSRSGRRRPRAYVKQVKESVPLVLSGHTQNIECLLGDNGLIISCCLGGHLKIWDSNSGECINTIIRRGMAPVSRRRPCVGRNIEDSDADLYAEYHGSRSSSELSLAEESGGGDGIRSRRGNSSWSDVRGRRVGSARKSNSLTRSDLKPDLVSTINTEFTSIDQRRHQSTPNGYDFRSWFEGLYEEHRRYLEAEGHTLPRNHSAAELSLMSPLERSRSLSCGEQSTLDISALEDDMLKEQASSVWCMASMHGLIVTGCGNGHIEMWDAETGELRFYHGTNDIGITGLCVVGNRIVAAKLDGTLDFLEIETFHSPIMTPSPVPLNSPRQNRGHSRSSSTGVENLTSYNEVIRCAGVTTCRAHQLPINVIQCAGGRIVTASQDHTLKVFRLDNALCLYTLHGHEASVTALCLDQVAPFAAVSGSLDGTIRMWDPLTGTCIHKFTWHKATVTTISTSPLYIVSVGMDDRMCVWDRTKSSLLHKIDLDSGGIGSAALMCRNRMVTGGQGSISLWDIPRGSLIRKVVFADSELRAFVNHVVAVANNGVVCDQGQDLKVVFFPTILEKAE